MSLLFYELGKSYHGKAVFANISGEINRGDKIGLVGANGIGKTTLARLLAGLEACDAGQIEYSPARLKVLYIEQHPAFNPRSSVYETIYQAASGNRQAGDVQTLIKKSLQTVGLSEDKWFQRTGSLSGGEKTKLALGKIMVADFDLLILDEPTNHLDAEGCLWLEELVGRVVQPLLIISHDRFFLDRTANRIWELNNRGLTSYTGNYSAFRMQKELELKNTAREYGKQQAKIKHLNRVINERRNWYQSAHQAAGQSDFYRSKAKKHVNVIKAKQKELARLETNKIDKPVKPVSPAFGIINKGVLGKKYPPYLAQIKDLGKSFGSEVILRDISFQIKRGDRIALIGANGAGKTTLLKTICGLDKDHTGSVTVNPAVKTGYFAQGLEHLDEQATILDNVLQQETSAGEARLLLANLLFRGDEANKKIAGLSMGERGRVAFARLILSGADLLILDEPTNYMDIQSRETIEAVLEEFKGILLFVSHDRYFIHRVANRVFTIAGQKLTIYDGNYDYYLAKCREQRAQDHTGAEFGRLTDNIRRLECELAFLGARLNEPMAEQEKSRLSEKYLSIARELNAQRALLK